MTPDLFEQGPGVYVPILLISLVITAVAYALFPVIFSKARNKAITAKKFKVLCFSFNFLVMLLFIAIGGSSSGAPYILWTSIFSSFGTKTLKRRCVIIDPQHIDDTKSANTQFDSKSDGALPTSSVPEISAVLSAATVTTKKKSRQRYCKYCGGSIDSETKICSYCGKHFFRLRINKSYVPAWIISIIAVCCIIFCLIQIDNLQQEIVALNSKASELDTTIETRDLTIDQLNLTIEQLKGQITEINVCYQKLIAETSELSTKSDFIDNHVVFVIDDDTNRYHKYDCIVFRYNLDSFWAYNTDAAIARGYQPCWNCF